MGDGPPQTYEEWMNDPHYKGLPFLVLNGADDIDKLVQHPARLWTTTTKLA